MSVYRCKICGGNLVFNPGDTVTACDSCGTRYTLSMSGDDNALQMCDETNNFNPNNEYGRNTVPETFMCSDSISPLLKRAFLFLEDGDWSSADEYCERVLDREPNCAEAYLGKLMAELKVNQREQLKECEQSFENSNNCKKIMRFADEILKSEISGYIEAVDKRIEYEQKEKVYAHALVLLKAAHAETAYRNIASQMSAVSGYKDADSIRKSCLDIADELRKNTIYSEACKCMAQTNSIDIKAAITKFEKIANWKDSKEKIVICYRKLDKIREDAEQRKLKYEINEMKKHRFAESERRRKKAESGVLRLAAFCAIAFIIIQITVVIPKRNYTEAIQLYDNERFSEAIEAFNKCKWYSDTREYIVKTKIHALKSAAVGEYVRFGLYNKDCNPINGKEDIEWVVIDKNDKNIFVISRFCIDCKQFNNDTENTTWVTCSLRRWLNEDFLNSAFSAEEKMRILPVKINTYDDSRKNISTIDSIFLLNIDEASKYLSSNGERQAKSTKYAVQQGAWVSEKNGYSWWLLRSPGIVANSVSHVLSDGDFNFTGTDNSDYGAVRPAMLLSF